MSRFLRLSAEAIAERRKKAKALSDYGLSNTEISQRLGMSRTLVYYDIGVIRKDKGPERKRPATKPTRHPRKRARKKPDFFSFLRGK